MPKLCNFSYVYLLPLLLSSAWVVTSSADTDAGADLPEFLQDLQRTIGQQEERQRELFLLDNLWGQGEEKSLGQRCGNRNPCQEGLDCVSPGVNVWKICLPTTCVQTAANDFNQVNLETGTTPFEDYVGNVLTGAGLSPTLFEDHKESELVNDTTLERPNGNLRDLLREDVREALQVSSIRENARNLMAPLHEKVLECFSPFVPEGDLLSKIDGAAERREFEEEASHNGTRRDLQATDDLRLIMFNGWFAEVSALVQFQYAWGTAFVPDGRQLIVEDSCWGGGPTLGGGAGYLMDIWWNGPGSLRRQLQTTTAPTAAPTTAAPTAAPVDDGNDAFPIPFLMADIDAALGPGVGVAYNTLYFLLINRLWFKFYVGAGGGLAFSLCQTTIDRGV